jgi:ribosomal protein S18 acetylase RimI-like enzyme
MNTLEVKQAGPDDEAVLFQLFTAVRSEELGMRHWDQELRNRMLGFQFEAQRRGYREQWPDADTRLILRDGSPVGWLIVSRGGAVARAIDLAIVPDARNAGIGARVCLALQGEAAAAGRPLVISVLRSNVRARALYVRLGFRVTGETDLHTLMEWRRDWADVAKVGTASDVGQGLPR